MSQDALNELKAIQNQAFQDAKRASRNVIVLQGVQFVAALLALFVPSLDFQNLPWIALGLVIVLEWASHISVGHRERAEHFKRIHERREGFGVTVPFQLLADAKVTNPSRLSPALQRLLSKGITYASGLPQSPERAAENLIESSWFSHHLASTSARYLGYALAVSIVVVLLALMSTAGAVKGGTTSDVLVKSVATFLIFLLTVGAFRAWLGLASFAEISQSIDGRADQLLERGSPSSDEVNALLIEYQVARACAPLIPTWVWKKNRNKLNDAWVLKRKKKGQ